MTVPRTDRVPTKSSALLSACRKYRYSLTREWDESLPAMIVVGLNPSTADETQDDPTIRRCIGFAKREGCGKLVMLNLFAFRATDPARLSDALAPDGIVGPWNDRTFDEHATDPRTKLVVAAWGAHRLAQLRARSALVHFDVVYCLGRTKDGSPRHPLYVRGDKPLEGFNV